MCAEAGTVCAVCGKSILISCKSGRWTHVDRPVKAHSIIVQHFVDRRPAIK
jgi:hypothetical protein